MHSRPRATAPRRIVSQRFISEALVNRFVGVVAVVGVGLLASALPVSAQNVSFGYQYQHLSSGGDGINMPGGFNVDVGVPIGSGVAIVGQFDWSRKSESEVVLGTSVDAAFNVSTYGGGVRWTGHTPSLSPFVDVLFGATHFSGGGNVAGIQVASGSENDAMLQLGGGVAVPLTPMVSAVGQFDYRRIFTDVEGTNSIRFVAGIRVGFGR
jgi:hypothetical protein